MTPPRAQKIRRAAAEALELREELLEHIPPTLAEPVREALAWRRLEEHVPIEVWEEARRLHANGAEPEPEPEPDPSKRPSSTATVRLGVLRRPDGKGFSYLPVPQSWARDYGAGQKFRAAISADGVLSFTPVEAVSVHQHKLSAEEVRDIRARWKLGDSGKLGREYGVSARHVLRIARGERWAE